jgi:Spy/CpxP family protein refolding chaperone
MATAPLLPSPRGFFSTKRCGARNKLDRSTQQVKELEMKFMKTLSFTAAGILLAGTALAQQYGMGPDMMGGYGMGSGMMGGFGNANGMGQGGMRGNPDGAFANLKLSPDQRKNIVEIQATSSKAMWQLMGAMHEQSYHMQGMYGPGSFDEVAARKSF